ncbi:MAG: HNH endonuclease [Micropruina sp.]|nr:HNH endonuclease [Micropruina sp.]
MTAGELRQYACDADILPVVLGGPSGVLDVGQKHRLVTPTIRQALHARDQGCVFAGCNRPAADCDAHDIVPWQQGGPTSLANLCLLCKHHHNLLEPDARRPADLQWQIRISPDGVAEVIPPRYVDQHRRPRRHQRFRQPGS